MVESLLVKKINQCLVIFDFSDPSSETEQKEIKQDALIELVEFFFSERGFIALTLYKDIFNMVSLSLWAIVYKYLIFLANRFQRISLDPFPHAIIPLDWNMILKKMNPS